MTGDRPPRLLLSEQVPEVVGPGTPWSLYDRDVDTPLNVLLAEAEARLERRPWLVWTDGGPPTAQALTTTGDVVVVFTTRYLEIAAAIRSLIVVESLSPSLRRELGRRLVLSIAAEFHLRAGRHQAAARCLLLAVCGQGLAVPHDGMVADLEVARIDESYAAVWFFAAAHELGHGLPAGNQPDDGWLRQAVRQALGDIPALQSDPAALRNLQAQADQNLALPRQLRREMASDGFAVEIVSSAARSCFRRLGRGFAPALLMIELMLVHAGISMIERCKTLGGEPTHSVAHLSPAMFHTTAELAVRHQFTRYVAAEILGAGQSQAWFRAVDEALDRYAATIGLLDSGLADAVALMIDPPNDDVLLAAVRSECADPIHRAMARTEHQVFLDLAHRLADSAGGRSGTLLHATLQSLT